MCTCKVLSTDDILEDTSIGKFCSDEKRPVLLPLRTMPYGIIVHLVVRILMLTEWKLSPDGKSLDVLINTQLNLTMEQVSARPSCGTYVAHVCGL